MNLPNYKSSLNSQRTEDQIKDQNDKIVNAIRDLQDQWSTFISLRTDRSNECIYLLYSFRDLFTSVTSNQFFSLATAGNLFANSLAMGDDFIDNNCSNHEYVRNFINIQAMQFEAYYLLNEIIPSHKVFWKRFRQYLSEYSKACIQEKRFALGEVSWSEYTETLAIEIIKGKTGVAKTAIAGLVEIEQNEHLLKPLEESIDYYYLANQMLDDILDWKEDIRNGMPSLLMSRLVYEWPIKFNKKDLELLNQKLTFELYYKGHAQYVLKLALKFLDQAEQLKTELPKIPWWIIISSLRHKIQSLVQDIEKIISKNFQRVSEQPKFILRIPLAQSQWQQLAWEGLEFIVKQWQLGFGEARHIMELSHQEGFRAADEYHFGDIFQRALITDTLCDANELLNGELQPLIDYEVSHLLKSRLNSELGGWSYFPTVPEIAPDADDLAQVMQVLLRLNYRNEVLKHCELPLKVLLRDNIRADGSIETWIVPAQGRTPQQERQAEFNRSKWGTGPDNEVMANILYALALYEPFRFTEIIQEGAAYLQAQQEKDGSWSSRWYYGKYYGTYVCLRLLSVVKQKANHISSALDFLKANQHSDGGWGLDENSDPLSTALALLSLAIVRKNKKKIKILEMAKKGLLYLQLSQEADKGWQNVKFIRPKASSPYGSRTITSMYVLKAALVWHQLLKG